MPVLRKNGETIHTFRSDVVVVMYGIVNPGIFVATFAPRQDISQIEFRLHTVPGDRLSVRADKWGGVQRSFINAKKSMQWIGQGTHHIRFEDSDIDTV